LDMPPNDALFDAINRGDIASAKDAISRGADLTAQNVLGLTPLDLSVDLGRNDISFLLLSLRAADTPPPPETAAAQPAAPSPRAAKPPVAPPPPREVAKSAVKTPQLYAGDGGAAVPQAGFLGFGSARPAP
jgi:ankyrin repeat protein